MSLDGTSGPAEPGRGARPGRTALLAGSALFALHAALLVVAPPIPPVHNGYSVPSYLMAYVAATLVAVAVGRGGPAVVAARAAAIGSGWWRAAAAAVVAAVVGGALTLRAAAPGAYYRFWREEGLFEPLSFLAYAGGAALLWRAGDAAAVGARHPDRRPRRLAAAFLFLLALEEIDYLGLFGGMIGRIEGEYAGALHDVIRLSTLGLIGGVTYAVLAAVVLGAAVVLWRLGYLRPGWLLRRATEPEIAWVALGGAFLAAAAAEEAHLFGWVAAQPTPEEAVELGGALCLAIWAVEATARIARR